MAGERAYIGLDLGGTNMRATVVRASGPTELRLGGSGGGRIGTEELLGRAGRLVTDLREAAGLDVVGVGVGLAGALVDGANVEAGMSNLPNLVGVDLAVEMPRRFGLPCHFVNDAQAALLAESQFGAARGLSDAICLTLGTGIGAGLLLDGRLRRGPGARAGEMGPWLTSLGDKASSSFEGLASPGNIALRSSRELGELIAMADTDPVAALEVARFFTLVGGALANVQLLLDLEAAIICGGVTAAGRPLLDGISGAFMTACPEGYRRNFDIRLGVFDTWASAIGAACLWLEE